MLLLAVLSLAAAPVCIANVHDGDSVRLCSGERIRIANIDAPELLGSERCDARKVRELARTRNPAWCDFGKGDRGARCAGGVSADRHDPAAAHRHRSLWPDAGSDFRGREGCRNIPDQQRPCPPVVMTIGKSLA